MRTQLRTSGRSDAPIMHDRLHQPATKALNDPEIWPGPGSFLLFRLSVSHRSPDELGVTELDQLWRTRR